MKAAIETKPVTFLDVPGCTFTRTSLKIEPGLEQEHWEKLGELLRRAESGIQWWLGDWMHYGELQYKDKYAQAVDVHDQTGINVDTLRYYQHVSEKVPSVRRLTNLSWSHHQIVAGLLPKAQSEWLKKAAGEGWSYRELKKEIEKDERQRTFKLVQSILDKIMVRIEEGAYTAHDIAHCEQCGHNIFGLELEEIYVYMQQLVGQGRAEFRDQGGKTDVARGEPIELCVPKNMPAGSDYHAHHPVEYEGDEHY